jgi:hypothetical protein
MTPLFLTGGYTSEGLDTVMLSTELSPEPLPGLKGRTHWMVSASSRFTSSSPPTSSQVTSGTSTMVSRRADGFTNFIECAKWSFVIISESSICRHTKPPPSVSQPEGQERVVQAQAPTATNPSQHNRGFHIHQFKRKLRPVNFQKTQQLRQNTMKA